VWIGIKAAIIASSCCSLPVLLAFFFLVAGVGSVSAALKIPQYRILFILVGTIFLFASLYLKIKKRSGGTCTINDIWHQSDLIIVSVVTYVMITALIIFVILPLLAELAFSLF
jgi:hypothetical protein